MQLRPDQLGKHVKGDLKPLYLVAGDEPLIQQECVETLRTAARQAGYSERVVLHAETGFDWSSLDEQASALSLFAERKIIELRIPNGKPGDAGSKAIQRYVELLPADNCLVITCPKLDKTAQRAKWFKAIDGAGVFIPIWPLKLNDLPQWVEARLRQNGLSIEPDALRLFCNRVEGNLLAAAQEITKLAYAGQNPIISQTIEESLGDNARFDIFGFIDAALQGSPRAVKMLLSLKAEGTDAVVVLWGLTREIRLLCQFHELRARGLASDTCFNQLGVWNTRKPLLTQCLKRTQPAKLRQLLKDCGDVDLAIKGQSEKPVWEELSRISLALAGAI